MSLTRRSNRDRNAHVVYTPSRDVKQDNRAFTSTIKAPYKLNLNKSAQSKSNAANKDSHMKYELKHDNLVMELSAACYEQFKSTVIGCLVTNNLSYTTTKKSESNKLVVDESISVKNQNKKQLYRINWYNTQCRLVVNGHALKRFVTDILPDVTHILSTNINYDELNCLIEQVCSQVIQSSETGGLKSPAADTTQSNTVATLVNAKMIPSPRNDSTPQSGPDNIVPPISITQQKKHPNNKYCH